MNDDDADGDDGDDGDGDGDGDNDDGDDGDGDDGDGFSEDICGHVVSFCICAASRGQCELVHGSFLAIVFADATWLLGIQTQPKKLGDPENARKYIKRFAACQFESKRLKIAVFIVVLNLPKRT